MNKETKKNYILKQIEDLLELMVEIQQNDEKMKANFLLPENYLDVQDIKNKIIKHSECNKNELIKLNYFYREMMAIKESIKLTGSRMNYKELLEWKIKDILENKDEESPTQVAIYYIRENIINESGKLLSLEEAVEYVERLRFKYSIKKR